jgi:hypothetical protein
MKPADEMRALAAIELADALIIDFNNPSSALKGIGKETMEKLLIYLKMSERLQRRRSKKSAKAAKVVNEAPIDAESEDLPESEAESEES